MGGALAQYTGTKEANVGAVVSFYGGFRKVTIDLQKLRAPSLLIYAEKDKSVTPQQGSGKNVEVVVYPGASHAFFNDTRKEVYKPDAAADAWRRTIDLFRATLSR